MSYCTSHPSSLISDVMLAAWTQLRWEYLNHRNQHMLQIGLFTSSFGKSVVRHLPDHHGWAPISAVDGKTFQPETPQFLHLLSLFCSEDRWAMRLTRYRVKECPSSSSECRWLAVVSAFFPSLCIPIEAFLLSCTITQPLVTPTTYMLDR